MSPGVVVVVGISGGGGVENIAFHGGFQRLGETSAAPAVVGHQHVMALGFKGVEIIEAGDGSGGSAAAAGTEELAGGDFHFPVHSGNALIIVAFGSDSPSNMAAVEMVVHWVAVIVIGIPPMYVVDVPVVVVIDTGGPIKLD